MIVEGLVFAFLTMIVSSAAILLGIREARRGNPPKIRTLTALNAIDEGIGRATEMGRPVHFSAGVGNLTVRGAPVMIASLSFLSHIAEQTARFDCPLIATVAPRRARTSCARLTSGPGRPTRSSRIWSGTCRLTSMSTQAES